MAVYLAFKELWRNRGRFLLFSLVIALITALVLFVAALAEGLGAGNRGYLEKVSADLLVYDSKADLLPGASRLEPARVNSIRRVAGIAEAASIGFSNVSIVYAGSQIPLKVALIGVEPGRTGEPPVVQGRRLAGRRSKEAILDRSIAYRAKLAPGDQFFLKSTQGPDDQLYPMTVVGITDGQQYGLQPTIFVPYSTWDRVKPGGVYDETSDVIANLVALRLSNDTRPSDVIQSLSTHVTNVQAVDRVTAYQALPGYSAQQSTLDTQKYFALVIGVLVIGGFFQIQTLQKVPQIGMLKAIGAPNGAVGLAAILQIVAVTLAGVSIGSAVSLGLSLFFPPVVPIVFSPRAVATALAALMLIGPLGGLVSVRYSLRVEPLTALGLG